VGASEKSEGAASETTKAEVESHSPTLEDVLGALADNSSTSFDDQRTEWRAPGQDPHITEQCDVAPSRFRAEKSPGGDSRPLKGGGDTKPLVAECMERWPSLSVSAVTSVRERIATRNDDHHGYWAISADLFLPLVP